MRKLDSHKLYETLKNRLDEDMRDGRVGAAHLLVLQEGEVQCSICQGYLNPDTEQPLREDSIYRLASMTKPVTSIATLIAVEQGLFSLEDNVSKYLPAFEEMYVAKEENGQAVPGELSPVPLRIWHLLAHCNGIMSETALGNKTIDATPHSVQTSLAAVTDYYATQPLAFIPERENGYSGRAAFDVAARIIELRSGMTYAKFLQKYLFDPLGLKDFTYYPTDEQWERMITPTDRADGNGLVTAHFGKRIFESLPLSYTNAGAGLAATMCDYAVFAEMLRHSGRLGDVQILKPETFNELVTRRAPGYFWGLGVYIRPKGEVLPEGAFGWSGAYGTHFWVDPENQITAIYMRCSRWYDSQGCGNIGRQFEKDVMACLE